MSNEDRRNIVAFTRRARKTIGQRDRWQCQGLHGSCVTANHFDLMFMARFQDGYFVTAAHYPHVHHLTGVGYHDKNPRNGRILCILCHAVEEIGRDNEGGARLLLRYGVYKTDYARENGQWYPTMEELYQIMQDQSVLV